MQAKYVVKWAVLNCKFLEQHNLLFSLLFFVFLNSTVLTFAKLAVLLEVAQLYRRDGN